jgi:integrase
MPKQERHRTSYPGVYYIIGSKGKDDHTFYVQYRDTTGKMIEEKVGKKVQGWSAAKANQERVERLNGKKPSNQAKREAEKAAKEAKNGKMTISKIWEKYCDNLEGLKSQAADKSRFTKYLEPAFGDKEPHEIIPLDIDRLRRKTLAGKSAQTTKHVLALLRRIVRYGKKKHISQPLTFDLEMPPVDNEVIESLNKDQLSNLLKTLHESDDIQISHLMLIALYTGMRKGELLNLRWDDVDLEGGFITIRAPKGGKTTSIPISNIVHDILKDHPRISENVFVNRKGKPFIEIKKRVEAIRKASGLPKEFRPLHGLRHVYASLLASSGKVDMYTLQKLLTHKSPVMTQRYAHLKDETLRKASNMAADIIGNIVSGSTGNHGGKQR